MWHGCICHEAGLHGCGPVVELPWLAGLKYCGSCSHLANLKISSVMQLLSDKTLPFFIEVSRSSKTRSFIDFCNSLKAGAFVDSLNLSFMDILRASEARSSPVHLLTCLLEFLAETSLIMLMFLTSLQTLVLKLMLL